VADKVAEYGTVKGEAQMQTAINADGPIVCDVTVTPEFEQYRSGIFMAKASTQPASHSVEIIGWGVDAASAVKYWIGRNSWGSFWGTGGWFNIVRGVNALGIESNCQWAVPDMKSFPPQYQQEPQQHRAQF